MAVTEPNTLKLSILGALQTKTEIDVCLLSKYGLIGNQWSTFTILDIGLYNLEIQINYHIKRLDNGLDFFRNTH